MQLKDVVGIQTLCANAFIFFSSRATHWIITALAVLSLITAPLAQAADTAGATAGQFTVTPTGAASYSIPIVIPPGVAGVAPKLSLVYNSQGGNGLLGMGWGISGLSAITRCPKTFIQDGLKEGVSYTSADKYCLDGQRLAAISGAYGDSGTQYRTERETYSKIISYGAVGTTGPAFFKVWTKAGQIMEFGNTSDSAIEAQGKTALRVWAMNKVADAKNNYLTISYTEDNTNGQYFPVRIDYTGNTTTARTPTNSVQFLYATRPDITPAYDGGAIVKSTVRLTNIQTHAKVKGADKVVKDYRFAYDPVIPTTNRSRLISVTECNGAASATCLRPTMIAWQDIPNPGGYERKSLGLAFAGGRWTGDFTGDGMADVVAFNPLDRTNFEFYLADGAGGFVRKMLAASNVPCANVESLWRGDFDADGKMDILGGCPVIVEGQPINYDAVVYFSNGDGSFTQKSPPLLGSKLNGGLTLTADFNGDGRSDVLTYWPVVPLNGTFHGNFTVLFSNGDGTFTKQVIPSPDNWGFAGGFVWVGDFNGDGKTDLMSQLVQLDLVAGSLYPTNPEQYVVLFSNGDGTFAAKTATITSGWGGYGDISWTGDFNGDGKTDGMGTPNNVFTYYFSKGDGSFDVKSSGVNISTVIPSGTYVSEYLTGDFNQDAKTDLLVANSAGGLYTLYSHGDGALVSKSTSIPLLSRLAADFTGDGKTDFVGQEEAGYALFSPSQLAPDQCSTITTSLGVATSVAYKPLTDASVYTKESTAAYPVVDIQAPIFVVSKVTSGDGAGGTRLTDYGYSGAKAHLRGGGPLGFRQVKTTNVTAGVFNLATYGQGKYGSDPTCAMATQIDSSYPYCLFDKGLLLSNKKQANTNGALLGETTNTWEFDTPTAFGPQYHATSFTQRIESSYELTGALISSLTTNSTYDGYGNPTNVTTTTNGGQSTTTVNTYLNDTVNWFIGRLTRSSVTSTAPSTVPTAPLTPSAAAISIAALSADKAEGNSGTTPFTFTVARSGNTSGTSSVNWAVSGNGAHPANAGDFVGGVLPSGILTFTAGQLSQTLTVNVQGNALSEFDAGFTVTLSAPVSAALGTSAAIGNIRNDDLPVISITALSADKAEGNSGATLYTFNVACSGVVIQDSTVNWAVTGSGASPANAGDFVGGVLPSGTLTFAAGQSNPTQTLTVNVQGDTVSELDASFAFTLSAPVNVSLGTSAAIGVIRNDDPPAISITALSADKAEGNSGATPFTFTVTRTGNTSAASSVNYGVLGSGAHPANTDDFVGGVWPSGTLSFAAGQTSQTLTINAQGNTIYGGDDEFTVTLSNPANAVLGTNAAIGVIRNDDTMPPPVISIAALSSDRAEGDSGATPFTFTISRSGMDLSVPSTVRYTVMGSVDAADFVGGVVTGIVSFAPNQASQTLTVNVQGDTVFESDEGFTVTLSAPTDATLGAAYTATGVIRNEMTDAQVIALPIGANRLNYNLKAEAIAAGWNPALPLRANVVVNGGVVISASSTTAAAFTIDGTYPAGSVINLDIQSGAYIVGKGGAGGKPGLPGGPAMSIASSAATVRITNNGVIGGGGGGGGHSGNGQMFSCDNWRPVTVTLYGGGGAGYGPGPGPVGGLTTGGAGATSYGASSGAGGSLGAAGGAGYKKYDCQVSVAYLGGAGGSATIGAANATWLVTGTRLGAVQ